MTMQNSDQCLQRARTEACFEPFHGLRCQRYFRNQHDRAFALLECVGNCLKINLSFAAAGDAVQEKSAGWSLLSLDWLTPLWIVTSIACWKGKRSCLAGSRINNSIHRRFYRGESLCLGIIKRERLRGQNVLARVRITFRNLRSNGDQTFVLEAADGYRRGLRQFE